MNKDKISIKGELDITMYDEHGKIVKHGHIKNLDFEEVLIGTKIEISVIIENDTNAFVTELQFKVDPEIKIESAPSEIGPNGEGILRLSWIPSSDLRQPINTSIKITGKEIYKNER